MDSFELNKMAGAFLGVVFVAMAIGIISDTIFETPAPEKPGYVIEAGEAGHEATGGEAKAEAGPEPIAPLLADADVAAGQTVFKKCQACHTSEEGGANKVGPNLWNIVNRPVASHEGFNYSAAMKDFSKDGSTTWTYAHLNAFLDKPKDLVKGTAMGFAGLKKVQDRANLVAYLRTLAPTPAPLPDTAAEGGETTGGDMAKPEATSQGGESNN